jgi:hypothetical protein
MEVKIYNAESFNRSKRRYVWFSTIITSIFILSILNDNIVWAIVLLFLLWWYFYYSVGNNQSIKLKISDEWLFIWKKLYIRNSLTWYALEVDADTQIIKNIVILQRNNHYIHTLNDTKENIKNFIVFLNDHMPILDTYEQSFLEKFARKIKL